LYRFCQVGLKLFFGFILMCHVVKGDIKPFRKAPQRVVVANYAAHLCSQGVEKVPYNDVAQAMMLLSNQDGKRFFLWRVYHNDRTVRECAGQVLCKKFAVFRLSRTHNPHVKAVGRFVYVFTHGNDVKTMIGDRVGYGCHQANGITALDKNKGLVRHYVIQATNSSSAIFCSSAISISMRRLFTICFCLSGVFLRSEESR